MITNETTLSIKNQGKRHERLFVVCYMPQIFSLFERPLGSITDSRMIYLPFISTTYIYPYNFLCVRSFLFC